MSDRTFNDDDMENGRVDPEDILSGNARHEDAPPPESGTVDEGPVTQQDLEQGRVDPEAILRGDVNVGGSGETVTLDAGNLADQDLRRQYEAVDGIDLQVRLSGDENVDLFAREWAEEHGAEIVE